MLAFVVLTTVMAGNAVALPAVWLLACLRTIPPSLANRSCHANPDPEDRLHAPPHGARQ